MTRIVLVLGMHRSGTSLVAKSTECLGASLGPDAAWFGDDNPTGFWESKSVLAIDEMILHEIGRTWDDPEPWDRPLEIFRSLSPFAHQIGTAAERLLRSRLAAHPIYAIKEPRLCRLLPFWAPIFSAVGAEVSVIHVVRHPAAVAQSLMKRNGIPQDKALTLWLEYTCRMRAHTWPSITVDYDELMAFPGMEVRQIGRFLGLTVDQPTLIHFAGKFVDSTLWHEPPDDNGLPTEVAVVWELEKARAREEIA